MADGVNVTVSTSNWKTWAIIIGSLVLGAAIFFVVMRYNNSWAEKLIFNQINKELKADKATQEQTIKDLNIKVKDLEGNNKILFTSYTKNQKELSVLKNKQKLIAGSAGNIKKNDLASKLTKGGY